MPRRSVLSLVLGANIIGPPCGLHEEHEALVGDGNVLQSCLPLVGVPRMFLHYRYYFFDGRRFSC